MKIGVIGSGTMGNGIAHAFASSGYKVLLHDINQVFLEKGMSTIKKNLNRFFDKQKITKFILIIFYYESYLTIISNYLR